MKAIVETDLHLPGQVSKYTGKVRDVYTLEGDYLVWSPPTASPPST